MSSQMQTLELANERLRSHELPREAVTWIHDVLEPEEVPYEILVGVSSSSHRDARPILTEEQIQASDFETVVLTNERIMFFCDDQQHEIPLTQLQSISVGDGLSLAKITFYTYEIQRSLEQVNVEDAHRFAEAARDSLRLPVRIGTAHDISDFSAQKELEQIDALRRAGLITHAEWAELRRPILTQLGLAESTTSKEAEKLPVNSGVRNAALVSLVVLAALITGALLMLWANGNGESTAAVAPDTATETSEPAEPPASTATQMQVPAPTEDETEEDPEEEVVEEEESPEPEPSEAPAAETTAPAEEESTGGYSPASQQAFEDAIGQYFTDQGLDTIAGVEFSEEQITVSLDEYPGNTEESAIDVSADLAILIAEENDIIDAPTHNARVSVPVDNGGVVAVNFDREAGQYAQVRE